MASLHALVLLSAAVVCDCWVLRMGGPIQATGVGGNGKAAFELFGAWANSAANTHGFTVEIHWQNYDAATAAQVATDMTDPSICSPVCVDVLVCPYGSGGTATTISGVKNPDTPILIWGGASDSLFSSTCTGFHCFGTLTLASQYYIASLDGIASLAAATSVGLIANDNAFSHSLADGIRTHLQSHASAYLQSDETVPRGGLDAAGVATVMKAIENMPDVVAIAGHSGGDVEDIIMTIASNTHYRPAAIISTNSITVAAMERFEAKGMAEVTEGLIMPQQWARSATMKDTVVGWTSADFTAALGADKATFHAAAAGGAAVALANAISAGGLTSAAGLVDAMKALDIDTFFAHVSFTDQGANKDKPMYAAQKNMNTNKIVMPIETANGYLLYPLSSVPYWRNSKTSTCSGVKKAYREHMCCGNPGKTVSLVSLSDM